MTPIVISPVTSAQILALTNDLKANKSTVTPDSATPGGYFIERHGVELLAVYAGTGLTVTIIRKPFFVTESEIKNGIRKVLSSA